MTGLRGPLFSLDARGRLTRALTLARRLSGPRWLLRGRPVDPKTPAQQSWRTMWQLAASLWHQLSPAEQAVWERDGTTRGMTGYAWYMSQALRPNPGIYLPLAGGDMTGVIDMQGNHIHGLDPPVHISDAASKQYVDWKVREEVTRPGCRVRRTSDQDIPNNTPTIISFDTQDYDNDDMWEGITNPTRVTIQTAGIYLITGQLHWSAHAAGYRAIYLYFNGATVLAQVLTAIDTDGNIWRGQVLTTYDLVATDFLELRVFQNSGAQLQALAHGAQAPVLSANRIG